MVIVDSYVCLCILMNTRRCIPVKILRLTKKLFLEDSYGFFEKLDLKTKTSNL